MVRSEQDNAEMVIFNDLRVKYPLDFVNCRRLKGVTGCCQLPLKEWVIIDGSKVGINYCLYDGELIHIRTSRLYGGEFCSLTTRAFNNWRKDITRCSDPLLSEVLLNK